MNFKFIVYCGQELDRTRDCPVTFPGYDLCKFPEADAGPSTVRKWVSDAVAADYPTVFVTRYEHVVSAFAELVANNKLSRDDVVFHLVQMIDGEAVHSTHQMAEDNERMGSNWPVGVLW